MTLSEREIERYSRQLVLPEWTAAIQERLRASSAIVIGAGALGSPAATYLTCAGVGTIGVADGDWVELSNLQRQPLHFTPDVETQKAESAAQKLGVLNTDVTVEPYPVEVDADNAAAIVAGADVVLDCTDSFASRYLINDACCAECVPLVEAGALGFGGMVFAIRPGETACYRCLKSYQNQRLHTLLSWPLIMPDLEQLAAAPPAAAPLERGDEADPRPWLEAYDAGVAPPVILSASHTSALEFVDLVALKENALDLRPEE